MAATRPTTGGPKPKSAQTTQNNGIKKASKPSEQQLYIVSRETNDSYGNADDDEIIGTYTTLAAANAAARLDLIKGWGREYFDTYEASEVDGMVHVVATCPDGEEMVVLVEKSGVKATPPSNPDEQYTYTVLYRNVTHHSYGEPDTVGTFKTLATANAAARDHLIKKWGREYFETYLTGEESDGTESVFATTTQGEEMMVRIEKTDVNLRSRVADKHAYTVSRETIPPYNRHNYEIIGTYETLEAANTVARNNMIEKWGKEYFEKFKVEESGGMVSVNATCHDGESMIVRTERTEVEMGPVTKKAAAQKQVAETQGEITVYHVYRHTIDFHNDPHGGAQDIEIKGTYVSLAEANEAAMRDLVDEWDKNWFEEYKETVWNGMVAIRAICPEGERMNVSVKKGKLFTDIVPLEELGKV